MLKNVQMGAFSKTLGALLLVGGFGLSQAQADCGPGNDGCVDTCGPTACDEVFKPSCGNWLDKLCGKDDDCCVDDGCADDGCGDLGCCDEPCYTCMYNTGEPFSISSALLGDDSAITIGGWTQFGYTTNSTSLFNNEPDRLNLHQQWFYAEKVADASEKDIDWGFRVDFMYGTDADDTQAFGNTANTFDFGPFGDNFAMPQLYGEVAFGDWSIIGGHFYTLLGYEVVTAPDNFFFSHAFTMFNSEAFTHTGVLATYSGIEDVTGYVGWTLGWDTGFDRNAGGSNFLGGASFQLTDNAALTYITTIGDLGAAGQGYTHSIVLDVAVTDNLNYVFQSDYRDTDGGGADPANGVGGDFYQYGFNNYLIYSINDCLAVGANYEYWLTDDEVNTQTDVNVFRVGMNVKPHANVIIRPEYRWQWASNNNFGFDEGPEANMFGIDCIVTY